MDLYLCSTNIWKVLEILLCSTVWSTQDQIGCQSIYTELKTLEWDILNPHYLIWVSNGHTFDFLLNLKWRAKFQIYRLHIRDSDWLDFIHFSGYKYKVRLVSISIKREDQALISISTILKFSAQNEYPEPKTQNRMLSSNPVDPVSETRFHDWD